MIPIVPIIFAIRAVTASRRSSGPARALVIPGFVVAWFGAVGIASLFSMSIAASDAPPWVFAFVVVPVALVLLPWPFVRFVYVPLGWSRAALMHARFAYFVFRGTTETGPAFAAALALSRARRHSEEMEARIVERVARMESANHSLLRRATPVDRTLDGPGVAALGFLAVSRAEREVARSLLRSVLDFPARTPRVVLQACMEWLAADAFDRGDADFLEDLASGNPTVLVRTCRWIFRFGNARRPELAPWTRIALPPVARLFASLSNYQRYGPGLFGVLPIWFRLARSGRPRLVRIVRHALGPRTGNAADRVVRGDALTSALSGHAGAVSAPASFCSVGRLKEICARWDAAFDDGAVAQRLLARELDLGITSEQTVVERMRIAVVEDLARIALDAGMRLAKGPGRIFQDVASRMRADALRSLEEVVAARAARIAQRGPVDCESELRDYLSIRDAYERAARLGSEPRRLALSIVLSSIWNHATTLFNHRRQRPFAHAQFRWLLREAEATGHANAVASLRNNVRIAV